MLQQFESFFTEDNISEKSIQGATNLMVSDILTFIEPPFNLQTRSTFYLLCKILSAEVLKGGSTFSTSPLMVTVIDVETKLITYCVVSVKDKREISLTTTDQYVLTVHESTRFKVDNYNDDTFELSQGKVEITKENLLKHNFLAILASVVWYVEHETTYHEYLKELREINTVVQQLDNRIPTVLNKLKVIKKFLITNLNLNLLLDWVTVRMLFRFLTYCESQLLFSVLSSAEVETLVQLCNSVDFKNIPSTIEALYSNEAFSDFEFDPSIDLEEEDDQLEEEQPETKETEAEFADNVANLNWTYTYKNNNLATPYVGKLQVSKCRQDGCNKQVVLGLPYCKTHMIKNLKVIIFDNKNYETNPNLTAYEDGVKAFQKSLGGIVFSKGEKILEYDGPFVEDLEKYGVENNGEMPYLPYSVKPVSESKWADGSTERHVLFMIEHSDDPNVELSPSDGKLILLALRDISHGEPLLRKHSYVNEKTNVQYSTTVVDTELEDFIDNKEIELNADTKQKLGALAMLINPQANLNNFTSNLFREPVLNEIQETIRKTIKGLTMEQKKAGLAKTLEQMSELRLQEKESLASNIKYQEMKTLVNEHAFPGGEPDFEFVDAITKQTRDLENILKTTRKKLPTPKKQEVQRFLESVDRDKKETYRWVVSKLENLLKDNGAAFLTKLEGQRNISSEKKSSRLGEEEDLEEGSEEEGSDEEVSDEEVSEEVSESD